MKKSTPRILVVAEDDEIEELYKSAFKDGGYHPQVYKTLTSLLEETFFSLSLR
ncbi:MAG: hypothetical protein Fur0044_40440 [Anaerolineae bacterium]